MKHTFLILIALTTLSCSSQNPKTEHFDIKENQKTEKQDVSHLKKTAVMLDENLYWQIIEKSLKHVSNQENQEAFLTKEIEKLSLEQIIGFKLRTDQLLAVSYTSELWCAGYIMNNGCSDDGFDYFRTWVISKGRTVFENALKNPDKLVTAVNGNEEYFEFELFLYVADNAFENQTGKDIYNYIDYDNFQEAEYPEIKFNWEEEKPESMKKICPNLYAQFWEE